jgi:Phage tail repeat like
VAVELLTPGDGHKGRREKINRNFAALAAAPGGGSGPSSWDDITEKPATFAPSAHPHAITDVTGLQDVIDGKQAAGSYASVAHGHGISDVSGLQAALDAKQGAGDYQPLTNVLSNTTAAFTAAQESKLYGIAPSATVNAADADLRDRATHTGEQAISSVTGLQTALDSKASVGAGNAAAKGVHATQPNIAAGQFVTPQLAALALTTIAAAANRLDYIPFIPARDLTVDRLDIEVTTLIAASQARVAIYADSAGAPAAILRDGASVLDCSTTGLKSATITALSMTAGTTYWLAILSSSTQTYRGIAVGGMMPMLVDATLNTTYVHKRQTQTFASGMPASASGLSNISGTVPLIKMRLA